MLALLISPLYKIKLRIFKYQEQKTNQHRLVRSHQNSRGHDDRSNPQGKPHMTPKTPETPGRNVTSLWKLMRLADRGQCKVQRI